MTVWDPICNKQGSGSPQSIVTSNRSVEESVTCRSICLLRVRLSAVLAATRVDRVVDIIDTSGSSG